MKNCIVVGTLVQQTIEKKEEVENSHLIFGSTMFVHVAIFFAFSFYYLKSNRKILHKKTLDEKIGKMIIGINLKRNLGLFYF
jgi:hypothetical protein